MPLYYYEITNLYLSIHIIIHSKYVISNNHYIKLLYFYFLKDCRVIIIDMKLLIEILICPITLSFFADNGDLMVYLDFRYKLKLRAANKYKMPMIKITSHPNSNFPPFTSGPWQFVHI